MTNYIVMARHKKLWRYLFMSEELTSEFKFWVVFAFELVNILCLYRPALYIEGILGKIEIIAPSMAFTGGLCSFSLAFIHHKTIFEVVSNLQEHYEKHKDIPKYREIIMKCHNEGYQVLYIFARIIYSCGVSFIIKPLIVFVIQYLSTGNAELMLPFLAVYPWEPEGVFFCVSFLLQTCIMPYVLLMVIINVGTSVFFCMAIVSHLQITQDRFKEITEDCDEEQNMDLLKEALKSHQAALELIKKVDSTESTNFFSQVFSTAIALSMCMFRVTQAKREELEIIVPFTILSISIIGQLGLICFYGQKIINETEKLYEQIYAAPWYSSKSRSFKSALLFCLMRAARADRLTAWSFADISMMTFNGVMTTTLSYVTFLQTMSE